MRELTGKPQQIRTSHGLWGNGRGLREGTASQGGSDLHEK